MVKPLGRVVLPRCFRQRVMEVSNIVCLKTTIHSITIILSKSLSQFVVWFWRVENRFHKNPLILECLQHGTTFNNYFFASALTQWSMNSDTLLKPDKPDAYRNNSFCSLLTRISILSLTIAFIMLYI